ncbi:RING-H2 finger protein ATL7 isoform X2 [Hevea brasiliensis]|uniref:RING-H2 finger protein ATL7 isoform X2 n=1 Tax=Hevea brasiliensis TaxID=3981 RepID=UPI0025D511CA|nr:RING-H2 finger protein ATL7 isoform X2 [Hevea brasiliensis]
MSHSKSEPLDCCSTLSPPPPPSSSAASTELKLYQAFIFFVPIFFTLILLFLFYLFYLRHRSVDWASLRMRANLQDSNDIFRAELGLKKEMREMLPIIVYKESFSVKDTQCPICLGDYQAEDRLQQIPACGHTFHMECIDQWLANHTTCPLCRLSLIASAKVPSELPNNEAETRQDSSVAGNSDEISVQSGPTESFGESQSARHSEPGNEDSRFVHNSAEERRSECADVGREFGGATNEPEEHENIRCV